MRAAEPLLGKSLVTQLSIDALHEFVLLWAPRRDDAGPIVASLSVDAPPRLSSEADSSPIDSNKWIGREKALFRKADNQSPTRS